MEMHRERMEVILKGGKPWGFSIKGGTENNKSIVVSKLEPGGKGKASGLNVGDIIVYVNDVNLAGLRRAEAVDLIRKSGNRLTLSIERSFPINPVAKSRNAPTSKLTSYYSETNLCPAPHRRDFSMPDHTNYHNNDSGGSHLSGYNNANNQKPGGYVFSQSNDKVRSQQQHIKETIKTLVIDPKREVLNNQPDIIKRERFSDKGRRSMPSATAQPPEEESPRNQPVPVALRHRQGNNKDSERPRSWHASKHPEIEQGMPSSAEKIQPGLMRRKSREWLETEDLRSTLDRKSRESLLSGSSTEQLSTSNTSNGDSYLSQHGYIARDRTSINSNPSLMEAVESLARSRPVSVDYDSAHSHHSTTDHRSSQDSLDSMSQSNKSYNTSFESKNSSRNEMSARDRLRSSGRYGEIWKLPQSGNVHRRAKSVDALSDDTPKRKSQGKFGDTPVEKPLGSSHSELQSQKNNSAKSPTPSKPRHEHPKFFRGEKGKNVDALISNFERGSPVGHVLNDENRLSSANSNSPKVVEGRHAGDSKSILKRLQPHLSHSTTSLIPKSYEIGRDKERPPSPPPRPSKYHMQSSGGLIGLYGADKEPDYPTLQSRTDEYKKNIQGMSKKVLRVTSFTRRDLEISPPYQSPVHPQTKSFRFPYLSEKKESIQPPNSTGNGPVRSKSTSSLLENKVTSSVVPIPSTPEETKQELSASLSPVQPTVCHVSSSVKLRDPVPTVAEEEVEEVKESDSNQSPSKKDHDLPAKDSHCAYTYRGDPPPPDIINHTDIVESPLPPPLPIRLPANDSRPKTPLKATSTSAEQVTTSNEPTTVTSPLITIPPILPTLPTQVPSIANIISASVNDAPTTQENVASDSSPLPPTSAYYQTSALKAVIVSRLHEKVEGGEIISIDNNETDEERNGKKVELLKRITIKLNDFQKFKENIKSEIDENEQLGKTVRQCVEKLCSSREIERFKTFVEEIDKIVNLIYSLSGRLARVQNTLVTLSDDADAEERNGLIEKKKKLTSQLDEANLLKENVNRRQENVCKILSSCMNHEEYGLFEHYIKIRTALISEQRDIDDKMKLGEEQMRELYDSLPESLQDEYPQYQSFLPSALSDHSGDSHDPN